MTVTEAPPAAWSISQEGERAWQAWAGTEPIGSPQETYQAAVALIAEDLAAPPADGLLAESWTGVEGIAFSEPTGDGRDFTEVAWSWRDPSVSLLPLMLQTKTDMGHFGAELAGYITELTEASPAVMATGRFYDSEVGRQARDLLLGDRSFGVSVDPGAVDATWECLEEDEDGWCTAERVNFTAYEIIGLTMTPFPAFERAAITLSAQGELAVAPADHAFTDGNGDGRCDACLAEDADGNCTEVCDLSEAEHTAPQEGEASVVVTAASSLLLASPPRSWFETPEPRIGDELLVEQGDGTWACPLTITDDGRVFGHVARWGQCHIGYPGACVDPPRSLSGYRHYHLGDVVVDDGEHLATGTLTVSADHAPNYLGREGATDHYAHTALAWADVRATDGEHGIWIAGALRPGLDPDLVRVLRASTLSGDWRGGEMVAALAVNTPGFPILRESLAASAHGLAQPPPRPQATVRGGEVVTLVAAGAVRRCEDCARRARNAGTSARDRLDGMTAQMLAVVVADAVRSAVAPLATQLDAIEVRTRHLRHAQAQAIRARSVVGNGSRG